jgi:YidC/Oxa1 family membrane protein insertase
LDKRLPLFLFLAFLIFFAWNLIFPPPPPVKRPAELPPTESQTAPTDSPPASVDSIPASAIGETEEREEVLTIGGAGTKGSPGRQGAFRARFSNRGARLLSLEFADYFRVVDLTDAQKLDTANWLPLLEPVETSSGKKGSLLWEVGPSSRELAPGGLGDVLWQMDELPAPQQGVLFRYSPGGGAAVFEKRIAFEPNSWRLHVTLALQNVSAGTARQVGFHFVPAACVPAELGDKFYAEPTAVAIGRDGAESPYKSAHQAAPGLKEPGALEIPTPLTLAGVHNKYFAFLMREARENAGTLGDATYAPVYELGTKPRALLELALSLNLSLPPPGERREFEYVVYAGPKAAGAFVGDAAVHQIVIDDDLSVDSIAKALLYVLSRLQGLVGNWGVAIILLTLGVRLALFPLNRRSQTSMARYQKKMKRVQPRLEEAKKRFENDPQKLREAQARIMQEEGAFPPLGGCLPIFLQMPVFFGLFSALRTSFDLRQAPFYGWIHDLSRPDRLLHLGLELPILPSLQYLNILPLLMVVLWVVQQLGMPKPADEQAARMQKMMAFMPIVFGFMLYNYAAGLSLYMITTSTCSIVEQRVIKKLWPIDDSEPATKAKKGCGPFSGIMQNLAEKQREQMKRMEAMQRERTRRDGKRRK